MPGVKGVCGCICGVCGKVDVLFRGSLGSSGGNMYGLPRVRGVSRIGIGNEEIKSIGSCEFSKFKKGMIYLCSVRNQILV